MQVTYQWHKSTYKLHTDDIRIPTNTYERHTNDIQVQLFHSRPLSSLNNILKYDDKITSENILFISKSINRQVPSMLYDWFTFSGNLHKYETCWSVTNYLNISTFQTSKYGRFSVRVSAIRPWNFTPNMLEINLSLQNSIPKSVEYVLSTYFIGSY